MNLLLLILRPAFASELPAAPAEHPLQFTVRVYDFAGVSEHNLSTAEEEAKRIFRKAGLETVWQHCPPNGSLENPDPVCREVLGSSGVYVRIVPRSMAARLDSRRDHLGFALASTTPGAATDAWVFYHRVDEVAAKGGAPVSVILGHVIAHEIGHLLLGWGAHSAQGIMREGWHHAELELAAQGRFVFTPEQSEQMQRVVMVRLQQAESKERRSGAVSHSSIAEDTM